MQFLSLVGRWVVRVAGGLAAGSLLLAGGLAQAAPAPPAASPPARIEFAVDPARPLADDEPSTLTVKVLDESGRPVPADVRVMIEHDASSSWIPLISTDFPHVEGTVQLDVSGRAENGSFVVEDLILPIRGTYRVQATASPVPGAGTTPVEGEFDVQVREKPGEIRNALILLAGLFAFGGLLGFTYGGVLRLRRGGAAHEAA